jgi:superfamily II DNA or RNA helicase
MHKFVEVGLSVFKTNEIPQMNAFNIVIANAHKFGSNTDVDLAEIPRTFDLVIVDEAHHYPAPSWKSIVDHFPGSKKLFLTAVRRNILSKYI